MQRTKDKECPLCGEMFSSQGLNGHLRFTHGLTGEEAENAYREAVPVGGEKYEKKGDGGRRALADNPVLDALRRITLLKQMLTNARNEDYRQADFLDRDVFGATFGDPLKEVWQDTKETIEERLEKAREDYKEAIAQRAEQNEQADS